jgi:dTDP-4-amino-4,6-dideoxygalactose transaminase
VLVDCDERTATIDVDAARRAVTSRTKALMPVHLYGQPADMDPLVAIAREHGLTVVEDAAQAHGAEYKGRRAGSMGDFGCFSFYPGKNLGACGEGGLVTAREAERARVVRMLRDWGQERKYEHLLPGFNFRMDAIQGAILRIKLRRLEAWTEGRRAAASRYARLLEGTGAAIPAEMRYARHVYHVYAIRTADREGTQHALHAAEIQTGIHYPIPVHLQPAHASLGYRAGDFPEAEAAAREVLSLPMYPELAEAQQARVAEALSACVAAR